MAMSQQYDLWNKIRILFRWRKIDTIVHKTFLFPYVIQLIMYPILEIPSISFSWFHITENIQ